MAANTVEQLCNFPHGLKSLAGHKNCHVLPPAEVSQRLINNLSQFEVSMTAKLVLLALSLSYSQTQEMFPKQKAIADKIGCSERSVIRAVKELVKAGLITIEGKTSYRYKFTQSALTCYKVRVHSGEKPKYTHKANICKLKVVANTNNEKPETQKVYYTLTKWAEKLGYNSSVLKYVLLQLEKDGIKIEGKEYSHHKKMYSTDTYAHYYISDEQKKLIDLKFDELKLKSKTNRLHYRVPMYKKVYSLFQYNREKYYSIYKKIQRLALKYDEKIFENVSPYRVLKLCYIKDDAGNLKPMGDERHIFRIRALNNIQKEIAKCLVVNYGLSTQADVLKYLFRRTHIVFYKEENEYQAEVLETSEKSIEYRLRFNIQLLRNLRQKIEIENAVKSALQWVNCRYKNLS